MKINSYILLIGLLITSCDDNHKANQLLIENTEEELVKNETKLPISNNDPVIDCYEFLSPIELKELWEMMKAETFNEKAICFGGYIYSKNPGENSSKGMIAFKLFKNEKVIPMVECEFVGKYKAIFDNHEVGEKIKIVGKLIVVEDRTKHNFIFTNCSVK